MTRQALLSFLVLSCVIAMGCRNSPTPPPQAESGTPTSQTKKRRDRAFTCAAGRRRDVLEDDLRVPADPPPGDETADEVPIFAPVDGYIIERLGGAPDHPMTLEFPEGEYLKGLVVMKK